MTPEITFVAYLFTIPVSLVVVVVVKMWLFGLMKLVTYT